MTPEQEIAAIDTAVQWFKYRHMLDLLVEYADEQQAIAIKALPPGTLTRFINRTDEVIAAMEQVKAIHEG